ncbi:hypothetical protein IQ270_16490 [Microcoleus sp. LEGE 07076]|uniref:hypothetical protein n=1 Tax=Microcoleus sp. LEGE 07076 TaxID=915322 RepID=UPI00187EC094|nr:hypothetical protein [Microcoleus sp. LEGE 07076]MBE9186242.1 hypothetical protein [Microcoleus sp. LEGE 07076]
MTNEYRKKQEKLFLASSFSLFAPLLLILPSSPSAFRLPPSAFCLLPSAFTLPPSLLGLATSSVFLMTDD